MTDITHVRVIKECQFTSSVCLAQTALFIRPAKRLNSVGTQGDKAW